MSWKPGDKLKLAIPSPSGETVLRSYTPAHVDAATRAMDIVVHLHGDGVASEWARSLRGGERTHFLGPASSMKAIPEHAAWVAFYGDETALGLAEAVLDSIADRPIPKLGALELAPEDCGALDDLHLPLDALPRPAWAEHGDAARHHFLSLELPPGRGVVCLSGEAGAVLKLREAALSQRGLERAQLLIKPFWSTRGTAHRKELERGALRR